MFKKLSLALLAVPAALVVLSSAASAHVPAVTADCRVLSVDLTDYEKGTTVAVNVDGETATYTFTGDFHKAIPFDATKPHTWSVSVDNKGNGQHDEWDASWKGTTTPCVPTTTKPPVVNVDLTPPTSTTVPVDYCATLAAYHTANPAAPNVDGWDYKCAGIINPPTVIDTQVQDRTVTPVAHDEALAMTGGHASERAGIAFGLVGVGIASLFAGSRFGRRVH